MTFHPSPPGTTWTTEPLTKPQQGFELCYDCDGSKLCLWCRGSGQINKKRCNSCFGAGWCSICGGAGEWPLDPNTPYTAPQAPQINLHYVAEQRAKKQQD